MKPQIELTITDEPPSPRRSSSSAPFRWHKRPPELDFAAPPSLILAASPSQPEARLVHITMKSKSSGIVETNQDDRLRLLSAVVRSVAFERSTFRRAR